MSPEYCMTPGCVQAAADILSNMDHSVNPCEDFYQFACGGFIEKTVIPDDRTRMSSFSVLSDELLTQVGVHRKLKDAQNLLTISEITRRIEIHIRKSSVVPDTA